LRDLPDSPAGLTSEWLSEVLNAEVSALDWTPIGTGQVGDSFRLAVRFANGQDSATYAAKFAAADPTSRATAAMFGLYTKEASFYRDIASSLAVRTPHAHFAAASPDGSQCLLLFEDLGPARQGDQVAGCRLEDARLAIGQAAAIHGPSWMRSDLLGADWIAPVAGLADVLIPAYAQAQRVFRERYKGVLDEGHMSVCDGLAELAPQWFRRETKRLSVVHGDFRLDNMLFDIRGGAEPIAVLDWQTVSAGNPLTDIGYLLGCGIGADLRRPHESDLLGLYRNEMAHFGVNFQDSEFVRDYRVGALHGVATAVFSAAHVERTERGDANFLSMARGACSLANDVDSLRALAELDHADGR